MVVQVFKKPTALLWFLFAGAQALQLTTTAPSKLSAVDLHDFLSRPANWPDIVASSNRVESQAGDPTLPMKKGTQVKEYFGANLLSVTWSCQETKAGQSLVVTSPDGLPGIASDCAMKFAIQDNQVELKMEYTPQSPLAWLATPVLIVDNWIALNVLLPAAVDPTPLDSFRKLMGGLYGVAGIAHLLDLTLGGSQLFTTAGLPVFQDMTEMAQAYALLWCAAGPLAFGATRQQESKLLADASLIFYGLIEVMGVILPGVCSADVIGNAAFVQAVVFAAWLYSAKKQENATYGASYKL